MRHLADVSDTIGEGITYLKTKLESYGSSEYNAITGNISTERKMKFESNKYEFQAIKKEKLLTSKIK